MRKDINPVILNDLDRFARHLVRFMPDQDYRDLVNDVIVRLLKYYDDDEINGGLATTVLKNMWKDDYIKNQRQKDKIKLYGKDKISNCPEISSHNFNAFAEAEVMIYCKETNISLDDWPENQIKSCEHCGNEIVIKGTIKKSTRFCSRQCNKKFSAKRQTVECMICKTTFLKVKNTKYCSPKCNSQARKLRRIQA